MTMGNAVRLARKNTDKPDMNKTFTVPWASRVITGSGKKIQGHGDKPESHVNQSSGNSILGLKGKFTTVTYQSSSAIQNKDILVNGNITESSGQQTTFKSVIENLQRQTTSPGTDSPKTEVRYIVLQPGQKASDLGNLFPAWTDQEQGQGARSQLQPQVLYLSQLTKGHPVNALSTSPLTSPLSRVHSEIKTGSGITCSNTAILPSLSEPLKPAPVPSDRAKDVVPGTDDKYRTPGSSFLNKNGNIKRPMNAFMVWARNYRAKLASHFQGDTNSQISIKLGDIWNSLSPEDKQPFYEEAERIKKQHKKEFPGWVYRPSPSKRRHEETAHHHLLWARYAGGSSSATLAAFATAAANRASLDSVQVKQEPGQASQMKVKQEETKEAVDQPQAAQCDLDKTKQSYDETALQTLPVQQTARLLASGQQQQESVPSVKSAVASAEQRQHEEQRQQQKSTTLKVLKAKLCGQRLLVPQCRKVVTHERESTNAASPRKSQSKTTRKGSKGNSSAEQQGSRACKPQKGKIPRAPGKKKPPQGKIQGIERREGGKYMLDLRSRSPATPPSTPRSVPSVVSPKRRHENTTERAEGKEPKAVVADSSIQEESPREGAQSSDWNKLSLAEDDSSSFPFPPHQYGPFDHLSPRDVPSDEILGSGRMVRESHEDLTRPEKVTSDIYLDLNGWRSFLTSSESTTKLTDDDVCDMFKPRPCEHGPECQVCTSDLDLAPKPARETLVKRGDYTESVCGDPKICLEVQVAEDPRKHGKADTEVDQIAGSICQTLVALDKPKRTNDLQSTDNGNTGPLITSDDNGNVSVEKGMPYLNEKSKADTVDLSQHSDHIVISDDSEVSTIGAEMCVEDDSKRFGKEGSETKGERFVNISLSADQSTHVVYRGDLNTTNVSKPTDCSSNDTGKCRDYKRSCIGCSLRIHDLENLAKVSSEVDQFTASFMSDTDTSSDSTEVCNSDIKLKTGAPSVSKPASAHVYKTDDKSADKVQDTLTSTLAPEVIQLTTLRSSHPESRERCEIYHRKIQTDISKYKLFDSNRSAKNGQSTRLKSAQLTRDGQSMKLGVFGEEMNGKGSSLSTSNMGSRPMSLQVDDLEGVMGTGMVMESREDLDRLNKKSVHAGKVAFPVDEGRKSRCKKKTCRKTAVREPDEAESDLCQGDASSKSGSSDPNGTDGTTAETNARQSDKMELLQKLVGREKKCIGSKLMYGESFDNNNRMKWNARLSSKARSQITSKIYVSRQTLPDPPRKKASSMRCSRNKPR